MVLAPVGDQYRHRREHRGDDRHREGRRRRPQPDYVPSHHDQCQASAHQREVPKSAPAKALILRLPHVADGEAPACTWPTRTATADRQRVCARPAAWSGVPTAVWFCIPTTAWSDDFCPPPSSTTMDDLLAGGNPAMTRSLADATQCRDVNGRYEVVAGDLGCIPRASGGHHRLWRARGAGRAGCGLVRRRGRSARPRPFGAATRSPAGAIVVLSFVGAVV